MDTEMPRADDLPVFKDAIDAVPAKTTPLGVKGAGEAGTTAAISALMNAVADAIPGGAGAHLDMPATAEKIWRACRQAQGKWRNKNAWHPRALPGEPPSLGRRWQRGASPA